MMTTMMVMMMIVIIYLQAALCGLHAVILATESGCIRYVA